MHASHFTKYPSHAYDDLAVVCGATPTLADGAHCSDVVRHVNYQGND